MYAVACRTIYARSVINKENIKTIHSRLTIHDKDEDKACRLLYLYFLYLCNNKLSIVYILLNFYRQKGSINLTTA